MLIVSGRKNDEVRLQDADNPNRVAIVDRMFAEAIFSFQVKDGRGRVRPMKSFALYADALTRVIEKKRNSSDKKKL